MNAVEKDILKKSEFNSTLRTIGSTVSVLVGMYFGGIELSDRIIAGLKKEMRTEFANEIKDIKSDIQAIKTEQGYLKERMNSYENNRSYR